MEHGTKQMIILAIEQVKLLGGEIVVINGKDNYKIKYTNATGELPK